MDSHVFRLLALELAAFLCGGRVEKIHSPAPGLLCLTVFNHGLKRVLVLRHSKIYNHGLGRLSSLRGGAAGDFGPALYLTERKLPNPQKPSTLVMTLRKQVQGHRLGAAVHDWVNRRVFFALPQPGAVGAAPHWLCLDLISGPSLHYELPEITTPVWPEPDLLPTVLREAESWRTYPVLTPLLRKSLSALAAVDTLEAAALLGDLHLEAEQGTGGLYLYGLAAVPRLISAWPLPPQVRGTMVLLDEKQATGACDGDFASAEFVYPGLEAARRLYEPEVLRLPGLGWDVREQRAATESAAEAQRGQKRLERTLLKLDQEESRLRGLADLRRQAIVLQGELWRYAPDERLDRIVLNSMNSSGVLENPGELEGSRAMENPGALAGGRAMESSDEQGEGLDGQPCEIRLDPLKSVRENMAALFKQSERGARGLAILADRRRKLTAELAALQEGRQPLALADGGQGKSPAGGKAVWEKNEVQTGHEQVGSGRTQGGKTGVDQTIRKAGPQAGPTVTVGPAGAAGKLVQRFVSSDGFVILRGRSALGNQAMLKLARPHEIWLHVQGGPSAHVLIRRDNLGVEVPGRTLREAAILSAVKSWRKNESKAEVILALARDVKPVKGGPPGSVLVDKLLGSLMVPVDFELEAVLLAGANGESASLS